MHTKTSETERVYMDRGKQLWKRASHELGLCEEHLRPEQFIDWFKTLLPTLSSASRRQYISSVRHFLRGMEAGTVGTIESNKQDDEIGKAYRDALGEALELKSAMFSGNEPEIRSLRRTSRQKSKCIKQDDLLEIIRAARAENGQWVSPSLIWLFANTLVGLRPNEWYSAKLEVKDGRTFLRIQNGKHTNGRANGPVRHLDISKLSPDENKMLLWQIKNAKLYSLTKESWRRYYCGARKTLHRITRRLWPDRTHYPSLYSSRHQFSANAKLAGLSKLEIAALLGHLSTKTAEAHYGSRKDGKSGMSVKPASEDVDRVADRPENQEDQQNDALAMKI